MPMHGTQRNYRGLSPIYIIIIEGGMCAGQFENASLIARDDPWSRESSVAQKASYRSVYTYSHARLDRLNL